MITNQIKLFLISILAFCYVGMLFSCENDLKKIAEINVPEDAPNEVIQDLTLILTDSGKVKVKLEAAYVEKFGGNDPITIFSDGLHLTFLDKAGNPTSELTAEYGEIREKEDRMVAKHNVVFKNQSDGKSLQTEELIWDQKVKWKNKMGKVHTDKPVTFTSKDGVIHGESLVTNESFESPIITTSSGQLFYNDSTKSFKDEQ